MSLTRVAYAHSDLGSETTGLPTPGGGPFINDKVHVRLDAVQLGADLTPMH